VNGVTALVDGDYFVANDVPLEEGENTQTIIVTDVEADEYAKDLSRYNHLNPVRANIVERPEEYEWSSYACFIWKKKAPEWLP